MGLPNGLHHLAINTNNIEAQLEFFTQACGMELVSFYWMHGVKDAYHIFMRLNDNASVALVRDPADNGVDPKEEHCGPLGARMMGAMQHVSFNVDNMADLVAMRDRIRSHGYQTFGPVDHGFCWSVYIPGAPEANMMMEFSYNDDPIDPKKWIDPTTLAHAGISAEQIKRYQNPAPFVSQEGKVSQPELDTGKQFLHPMMVEILGDPKKTADFEAKITQPKDHARPENAPQVAEKAPS